ncbi:glycosyltransferase [Pseudarthrobacter defluvii]|uniref:glycosyltransferase n=1 Tax=Pseudarthrobacter defluvii TaxID=410837 RepID=UPI00257640B7|nr:glycosyltransferase [Pseudarthrobacter defluvii]WJH23652.1 glycosyltransferase [Pseudarthrobacter defluvii]
MAPYTFLALGPASATADAAWLSHPMIKAICQFEGAAITGKRWGSRVLGIGFDALVLALKTLNPSVKGPYFATNPWIGAALRLTGRNDFVVTGIYAEPSSLSWKILRRLIGNAPVISMSESETGPWNADGGKAWCVLYGNSLGYPPRKHSDVFHIFVGGSSDRDPQAISALEEEVLASTTPVQLTIATGGPAGETRRGANVVTHPGYVSQKEFGELLCSASVVFLPLARGTRAAGHMVLVGAVESGIAVAVTPNEGMKEYVMEPGVVLCDPDLPILPQLRDLADATRDREADIRALWEERLSLDSYIGRIMALLEPVRA